jgi:hypothetical protein
MNRLGRRAHSPAAVAAAPSLRNHVFAMMAPPTSCVRTGIDYQPQLRGNDTLPDCVPVGILNAALAVEALNAGGALAIAPDVELAFYATVDGCAPTADAIAATDGLSVLDALRRQSTDGFDIGAVAPLTADFASVPLDLASLANSIALIGVGYWGVDIYSSDMDADPSLPWDDDGSDPGTLVGGHCLCGWDYEGLGDMDTGRVATWGRLQSFRWRWLKRRLREAYVLLFPDLQRADGTNWASIDLTRLRADIKEWVA